MKKLTLTLAALALGFGGPALAGVAGSDHDLSGMPASNEICVYCHTPHQASNTAALWNRDDPTGPFTMYSSATLDMTIAGAPQAESLACLSCHDGTIAIDAFGGGAGTTYISSGKQVGPDLSTEHPVSITYDPTKDTKFVALATVQGTLPLYGASNDQVECASCHNPHDTTFGSFLRISNSGSNLCLTCHDM